MAPLLARLVLMLAVAGPAASCSRTGESRTLDVFAAASLREAFQSLGATFSAAHPEATVVFNFAGSQELRTQIEHDAPADVFASADHEHMNALVATHEVEPPVVFAKNELVLVCPRDGRAVTSLETLPNAARIVIGAPTVPIGRYTLRLLDAANGRYGADFRARVEARVVSRESNVRQVLAKVTLGEADAAIVYRTDAALAKDVRVIDLPPEVAFETEYPIAVVSASREADLARAWIALVRSPEGQAVLARAHFRLP